VRICIIGGGISGLAHGRFKIGSGVTGAVPVRKLVIFGVSRW